MLPIKMNRTLARYLLLVVSLLAPPVLPALHAQQSPPRGRIEGEIVDSVHSRKLAGAMVMATRVSPEPAIFFSTTTGANGRFRFDTLAAGHYAVAFSAALLDSLDLILPGREVDLLEDGHVVVDFATPSGATFRAAACPGLVLPAGQGAVVGEVLDADTERPIGGVRVAVGWGELVFDRATLQSTITPRTGAVTTDSLGHYRLCGVPTDERLSLQVQTDSVAGAEIQLIVDDSVGVSLRRLSLSASESQSIAETAVQAAGDTLRARPRIGTATLTGVVRAAGGRPLPGAFIRVVDARSTATADSSGRFELLNLPAGSQVAEVRKLGYFAVTAQVELRRRRSTALEVQLTRFVSLDSVRIIAQRSRYREFEEHKRGRGWGTFLDEEQLARRSAVYASDLLQTTPGVRVTGFGMQAEVTSSRGSISFRGGACRMNVVIDGMPNMDINMISASEIGAIEVYPSGVGVPLQYMSQSPCGAVIIWTKR